jgi:hypothetical protein
MKWNGEKAICRIMVIKENGNSAEYMPIKKKYSYNNSLMIGLDN